MKRSVELIWADKVQRPPVASGALVEIPGRTYPSSTSGGRRGHCDNRLIFGDNLHALHALQREFAGRVKCVYIDPPYNTGAALPQYDDDMEQPRWLSFLRDRLELMRSLLAADGVLFASIDDTQLAYLSLVLDEVFGRANACGTLVWEKKKKPSFLDANMGIVTEFVLAYARDRAASPAFVGGTTTAGKKYPLNNAGNGVRVLRFPEGSVQFRCRDQRFEPQDMSAGKIVTRLLDPVEVRASTNRGVFRLEGEWRYAQATLDEYLARGDAIVITKAPFRPNHVRRGGEPKKLKNLLSAAHFGMSTYEDATRESRRLFGDQAFPYPKPEKLLATLIAAVTRPGDWVLDAFAGSGTTGAVAHKLGRQWIMIEQGAHCHSHIVPRLTQVIDGTDAGGITESAGWTGGGRFRFFLVK